MEFEHLVNFRDLGGLTGDGGRTVRHGRLYRSDSLAKLRGPDLDRFAALGVRTVIDLRYPWEIARRGRAPAADGLAYHNLSIEHRPYDQATLGPDVDVVGFLAQRYAEVAADGVVELRRVLELIADADSAPVVFHCAAGKDRTGIVAALVLSLLGVPEADVVADFARTGLVTDRLAAAWRASHPDLELTWPGYGQAPPELMRRFLDDLNAAYGSVHRYVVQRLGVGEATIAALRAHLLNVDSPGPGSPAGPARAGRTRGG